MSYQFYNTRQRLSRGGGIHADRFRRDASDTPRRAAPISSGLRDSRRLDPGNLSRIERGRAAPPQDPEILARLVDALELTGTEAGQTLIDVAATQTGRIPRDILSNEELMSALPVLLRTVNNKQLDGAHIEKLVELIKKA